MGPIEDFLFNTKKGYCEHYASSMVLMLRSLGIPSRVVTGFYGGEKNEYGAYLIVRKSNAHSWVEALTDGRWKRFDPTPTVAIMRPSAVDLMLDSLQLNWSRYVVGFSFSDQREILRGLTMPFRLKRLPGLAPGDVKLLLYWFAAAVAICLVIFLTSFRMRRRKSGFVTGRYLVIAEAA